MATETVESFWSLYIRVIALAIACEIKSGKKLGHVNYMGATYLPEQKKAGFDCALMIFKPCVAIKDFESPWFAVKHLKGDLRKNRKLLGCPGAGCEIILPLDKANQFRMFWGHEKTFRMMVKNQKWTKLDVDEFLSEESISDFVWEAGCSCIKPEFLRQIEQVVILTGFPGVGKTTLAKKLGEDLGGYIPVAVSRDQRDCETNGFDMEYGRENDAETIFVPSEVYSLEYYRENYVFCFLQSASNGHYYGLLTQSIVAAAEEAIRKGRKKLFIGCGFDLAAHIKRYCSIYGVNSVSIALLPSDKSQMDQWYNKRGDNLSGRQERFNRDSLLFAYSGFYSDFITIAMLEQSQDEFEVAVREIMSLADKSCYNNIGI